MLQDYQSKHYESVLKVTGVFPPGIVLPVTDTKSNKLREAINDKALGARAKSKNKEDWLVFHVPYRLRGTLNSVCLLFLQAGIKVMLASFPGTWSPVSLRLLCGYMCRGRSWGALSPGRGTEWHMLRGAARPCQTCQRHSLTQTPARSNR